MVRSQIFFQLLSVIVIVILLETPELPRLPPFLTRRTRRTRRLTRRSWLPALGVITRDLGGASRYYFQTSSR